MILDSFRGKKKSPDQHDEKVRDPEKAREMAEVEDEYRELAYAFKQYMEDPVAYRAEQNARVEEAAKDGAFTYSDANDYMELYQAGIRPSDLEQLGEEIAEMHGEDYDFEQSSKELPSMWLKAMITFLKVERKLSSEKKFVQEIGRVDFGADEHRSLLVTHLLNQLGAGDEHAANAEEVHQWLRRSEELQRVAEAELQRRKNHGIEAATA